MSVEELNEKCISGSNAIITEGTVMDIYAYLRSGKSVDDYPDKGELQTIKDRFKELVAYKR